VRGVDEFAATMNATAPLPVPVAPPVTVSQPALLDAVQVQCGALETVTFGPAPPAVDAVNVVGEIAKTQASGVGVATAACVTLNVCPAIVSVPVRAGPVLAATL